MGTHSHIVLRLFELLFWYTLTSSEVTWVRITDPVIFGGDVTLECLLPEGFDKTFPRQWKTDSTSLTLNENPADRNKYVGLLGKDGFTLTIKTFQVEDFGRNYICSYGFEFYRANLTTKNYLWIPLPDEYEVDVLNSTIEMIQFTVQFQKVYPEPNCTSLIGDKAIPAEFTNSTHVVDRYFLATNLTLEYHYDTSDCGEEVSILCRIGDKTITVNISTPRQCAEEDTLPESTSITTGIIVAVVIFPCIITSIIVACMFCRKGQSQNNTNDVRDTGLPLIKGNCVAKGSNHSDIQQ